MSEPSPLRPVHDKGALPLEALSRQLEALGLAGSEARVLLALLQVGSATSVQLARLSGVPRASTYVVIDELASKALIERQPGEGPSVWTTPGFEEVMSRLEAIEEERHNHYRLHAQTMRAELARALPSDARGTPAPVRLLPNAAQVKRFVDRLFGGTELELLVLSRPPYLNAPQRPLRAVMQVLERGVPARCLTRPAEVVDSDSDTYRADVAAYAGAGMVMRLVDELDLKMVVSDRRLATVSLVHGEPMEYPATMLVEDPGLATLLADGFERRWDDARPWPS